MSFPYPYIDHYSPSPVTSTPTNAFAQWDITQETATTANATQQQQVMQQQQQQQQLHQQLQQAQQQGQQELDRNTPTSAASTPAGYEPPQVIQLTERVPRRRVRIQNPEASAAAATSSGNKSLSPSTPLRNLHQLQQPTPQSVGNSNSKWYPGDDGDKQNHGKHQQENESSQAGGAVRQMNTSRAQARLASHPYQHRRAVSGESAKSKRDVSEQQQQQQATSPTSGLFGAAQIVMACGGAKGRNRSPSQASAGSPTTSPTQSLQPLSDAAPHAPVRRMLIRTDVHQSATMHALTAMLELPGVNKADVRVALSVDPFSGVHQLTVTGRSTLRFPSESEGWYIVRERKYGEFRRVLVVPPDTKAENVEASMEDGILYLRYPGAAPSQHQEDRASSPTDEPTVITVA